MQAKGYSWTLKDYQLILKALRKDKSEKIPKRKQQLVELYDKWRDRTPLSCDQVCLASNVQMTTCIGNSMDVGVTIDGDDEGDVVLDPLGINSVDEGVVV